ncbi:MAG: sodium-dependent transporter [Bacteroidia bacterium]
MIQNKEHWGSRIGLILAMAGNAVGLGNFLRFPMQAIQNGGGAFLIPYLVCFVLLGIPLLWTEWAIGRYGGKQGYHTAPFLLQSLQPKYKIWRYLGALGIFTNLAIASYYCYVESWSLSYMFYSLFGSFSQLEKQSEIAAFFVKYVSSPNTISITAWLVCLGLNTWVLSKELSKGVEMVGKIGMTLLLLFGIVLAVKGVTLREGEQGALYSGMLGLNFLWTPDFSTIWNVKVWLAAAGQVFFTLSLGAGAVQCYASYLKEKEDIALNAMAAGWMNEFVEVVLGSSIIIPISIGYFGIEEVQKLIANGGGLGLGFQTLPFLFQQWGKFGAAFFGFIWFALLFFAGITSSLAMGTPVVAFLQDHFDWKKTWAALLFGGVTLLLGLPTVLYFQHGVFDEFDYWAGTVALVVFALIEVILFVWIFGLNKAWAEINEGAEIKIPIVFKYILGFVTPILLLLVFLGSLLTPAKVPPTAIASGKRIVGKDTVMTYDTIPQNEWRCAVDSLRQGKGYSLDNQSIVAMLTHQGIQDKIIETDTAIRRTKRSKKYKAEDILSKVETYQTEIIQLRAKRNYSNFARIILAFVFLFTLALVFWAGKREEKAETVESSEKEGPLISDETEEEAEKTPDNEVETENKEEEDNAESSDAK